jgi:hypothetical protein
MEELPAVPESAPLGRKAVKLALLAWLAAVLLLCAVTSGWVHVPAGGVPGFLAEGKAALLKWLSPPPTFKPPAPPE